MSNPSSPFFSNSWYRVAALKPRLRRQARVVRHTYRGERWYVLQDLASGRFLRLDPIAYRVVALMDGIRTIDEIWQGACGELGDEAPSQNEVIGLLSQLHQSNVLLTERQPDLEELEERGRRTRRQKLKQYLGNPLGLKFPLLDIDRSLGAIVKLFPRGSGRFVLLLWLALVASGAVVGALHWDELTSDITTRVFTPENVFLLWLTFPLLKAIHELGHGLALKAYGGSCREMGLMLLILMPVPYVDASAATAFPDKRKRMVVGLAGMMMETAVASAAIWLWTWTAPGMAKAMLHQVVLIAGITTVVFNANPLLRFDGYYVLADWLEIPNLGQKANRYVGYLIQRYVFRVRVPVQPPRLTPRESPWLLVYAVGAFLYRTSVAIAIVLMVAGHYFFVGILLAAWAVWMMLLMPVWRVIRFLVVDPVLDGRRPRALALSGGMLGALVATLSLVPVPSWTVTEGIIWVPEQTRVVAPHACFAQEVLADVGGYVDAGQPLVRCADPELQAKYVQAQARVAEIEARLALAEVHDQAQARILARELEFFREIVADLAQRHEELLVRSRQAGRFVMEAPADFPGRYLQRGEHVAHVLDPSRFTLLAVVPQGDVDLVRSRTLAVELRTVDRVHELLPAEIVRQVPAATRDLPSLALALQGGGRIGLDPTGASGEAPRALAPLFQFEIRFSGAHVPEMLGSRVYVRFVHDDEPLARQWMRSLRQLFIKRFAV